MSSSSELGLVTHPLRGDQVAALRPARLDADLRTSPYAGTRVDPRLSVPALADVVDAAARAAAAEARSAGYADGYAEGRRIAAAEAAADAAAVEHERSHADAVRRDAVERVLDTLEQAAAHLLTREAVALAETEDALVRTAVDLAEALLGRELAAAPERGRDALARALALLPGSAPVVVHLHPDDVASLGDLDTLSRRHLQILADPTLQPGDCVAESAGRNVDARLDTALERVRKVLEG